MRCAFCHGDLGTDAGRCDGCGTRLHLDCARAAGTCPTLGCGRTWSPTKKEWAGPSAAELLRRAATIVCFVGMSASCLFFASKTPFYGGRGLHSPRGQSRGRTEAEPDVLGRRPTPVDMPPSIPPPALPGDAPPGEVLAACRALLGRPELRSARLDPGHVATQAPALARLRPALVVVERAAVVVDLGRGRGLVALPVNGSWADVDAFAGTRAYTLEKVVEGLWLYERW